MNNKVIKDSANAICAALRQNYPDTVSNLCATDSSEECNFSFQIDGKIDCLWRFDQKLDYISIQMHANVENRSEDEVEELLGILMEELNDGASDVSYPGTIGLSFIFKETAEAEDAVKKIFNATMRFFSVVLREKDKIIGVSATSSSNDTEWDEEDMDAFGFDSLNIETDVFSPIQPDSIDSLETDKLSDWEESTYEEEDLPALEVYVTDETNAEGTLDEPDQISDWPDSKSSLGTREPERKSDESMRPTIAENEPGSPQTEDTPDVLYSQLDELQEETSKMQYDPNGMIDIEEDTDGFFSVLEQEDIQDDDLVHTSDEISGIFSDIFNNILPSVQEKVNQSSDKMKQFANSISLREKDLRVREKVLKKDQEEYNAKASQLAERENQLDELSSLSKDNEEKDRQISRLMDELNAEKIKAEDAEKKYQGMVDGQSQGTAGVYLQQLKEQLAYREDYIHQLSDKLHQYAQISKQLQKNLEESSKNTHGNEAVDRDLQKKIERDIQEKTERNLKKKMERDIRKKVERDFQKRMNKVNEKEQSIEKAKNEWNQKEKDYANVKEELNSTRQELNSTQGTIRSLKNRLQEKEDQANRLQNRINQMNEEEKKDQDPIAIASVVKSDLEAAFGEQFRALPGESKMIIQATYQEASIHFNAETHILFVTYPCRNKRRVDEVVSMLNEKKDIYAFDARENPQAKEGEYTCKAFCLDYHDTAKIALDLIDTFTNI